jgi:tetratricopeptide (TPR) repeat protein
MAVMMRASWWQVFLYVCSFGMYVEVLIIVPSEAIAAENRASVITLNNEGNSLQQTRTQGQAEIDEATGLLKKAEEYYSQEKYAEAEPLLKRALEIREKALGKDHPDTATILNNLAALYNLQGDYAEAEPLYKRALDITEKALGKGHPNVANILDNYADLLRRMNSEDEAAKLEARAAEIRARANRKP